MKQQFPPMPGITEIPEGYRALWELCLADVWCPVSVKEWRERVDSIVEIDFDQTIFVNLSTPDREELTQVFGFPMVELPALPTIAQVNEVLPSYFEANYFLKQSDLAAEITRRVHRELPQITILLVFDGLSFYEVTDWEFPNATLEPCLVDGLSTTESAMQRLISVPVLTHRLFDLGYVRRLGFSYWERSTNLLTNSLFSEFPKNQLHRIATFDEVLETIKALEWPVLTYIQIIRSGLDSVCHFHRERPNITMFLENLKRDVLSLFTVLQETGKSFRLFVTADHGILWYHEDIVSIPRKGFKARYTEGHVHPEDNLLTLQSNERLYTVLTGDKIIAKGKKNTEWGFHGGISAQESLVPFWDIHQ